MTAMVNLINSVGCKYLLPCGICDKTGSLCSQLETPYTPTPDIPMISVYAAPSRPYPSNYGTVERVGWASDDLNEEHK